MFRLFLLNFFKYIYPKINFYFFIFLFYIRLLFKKAAFMPYMFGVNTRFYGGLMFKLFFFKMSVVKTWFYSSYKLLAFSTPKILFTLFSSIIYLFQFFLYNLFEHTAVRSYFRDEVFVFYQDYYSIIKSWALWFSHFFYFMFKEYYHDLEQYFDIKNKIYMQLFKLYAEIRYIYFRCIVFFKLVHSSRRRRFKV